jgi:putative hydrolase of the HAD superfamily
VIRAVSFDATGTLFGPRDLAADYVRILGRHGVRLERDRLAELLPEVWREFACSADPSRDRFASHPGGSRGFWRDVVARVVALAGLPAISPFAVAELYEHFARAEAWSVYSDVVPALERLAAAGLRLAVTSNWDERLPRVLSALGLAERFTALVVSAEIGAEKPHPRIFAATAERLRLDAGEILHVGDRWLEDVEGAAAAGMPALWLRRAASSTIDTPRQERGGLEPPPIAALDEIAARLATLA